MKWCIPAFGISLIVFLVLFAGIEAKQLRDEERARASTIESNGPVPGVVEEALEVNLGAIGSVENSDRSTSARAEWVAPPPPPLGPPDPSFEAALEQELAQLRPALITGRSFSRAQVTPRRAFDLTRLELRPEDRGILGASFLITGKYRDEEDRKDLLPGPWRLDVRLDAEGALVYRSTRAGWSPFSRLLRHPVGRVSSLPLAEESPPPRYRYRGEHFQTMTAEMVRVPLEKRSKHLGDMSLFGRSITAMSTFNITFLDEPAPEDAEADFICQLTADIPIEGMEIHGNQLLAPVRYQVSRGEFEVKVEGRWRGLAEWATRIRPHTEMVSGQPLEKPDEFLLIVEWRLDS